jgi:hypothetical protein
MSKWRFAAAAALVLIALYWSLPPRPVPEPTPAPSPDGLNMRGTFIGPSATDDAALLAALCGELADVIEWDGMKAEPRLKSGLAFDELRVAAREGRCRGESIGQRQPHARKAIEEFLNTQVGVSGGPVGPQERSKWVAAYRELARACSDASK